MTRNESEQEGTLRLLLSVPSSTIPNEGPLTIKGIQIDTAAQQVAAQAKTSRWAMPGWRLETP